MTTDNHGHLVQPLASSAEPVSVNPASQLEEKLLQFQPQAEQQIGLSESNNEEQVEPADDLTAQLQLWYQQSAEQHRMPPQQKQQLQQRLQEKVTYPRSLTPLIWLGRQMARWGSFQRLQALTAVCALGLGWFLIQQQQQLSYQISQTNSQYPVQLHQLNSEKIVPEPFSKSAQRQQIFSQRYQDYQKSVAAGHAIQQQVLARQSADSGWLLDACDKMQLQLTEGWLTQFKLQQQWSEPQWAQLAGSRYLTVSTGTHGEIIALQSSTVPPSCAP